MKKSEIIQRYLRATERVWLEKREKELDRTRPYKWFEEELRKIKQTEMDRDEHNGE